MISAVLLHVLPQTIYDLLYIKDMKKEKGEIVGDSPGYFHTI